MTAVEGVGFSALAYKAGMSDSDVTQYEANNMGNIGGGSSSSSSSSPPIVFSVWDGDWALLEEYDSSGNRLEAYLQGYHGLVKTLVSNIYYYQDELGSTSHVANSSGALLEYYKYDLYGKPTYWSSTSQQLNSSTYGVKDLFTGQRWVVEIGLYDDRNRFMSPDLGRFLQPDPIGFKGDSSNLYRYVGNDWANRSDPTGLGDPAGTADTHQMADVQQSLQDTMQAAQALRATFNLKASMGFGATQLAGLVNQIEHLSQQNLQFGQVGTQRRGNFFSRLWNSVFGHHQSSAAPRTIVRQGVLHIDDDGIGLDHGDQYHKGWTSYKPNGRSLNADTDPYVAVLTSAMRLGVRAGDRAILSGNGQSAPGVVGDFGSPGWVEASIAHARAIGVPTIDRPGGLGPVPNTPGGRDVPVTVTIYPSGSEEH